MRKHFIVKPKIQMKYLFITVLAVIATGLAVYFALWSSLVNSAGLEQFTAGEWKALERAYQMSFLWVLVIIVIGFGLESLVIFHRVIGPVFKERVARRDCAVVKRAIGVSVTAPRAEHGCRAPVTPISRDGSTRKV